MSCATFIEKRGRFIRAQAESLQEELGADDLPSPSVFVSAGLAMGYLCRSLATHISNQSAFREARQPFSEAVEFCLFAFKGIDRILAETPDHGVPQEDIDDFMIAHHEVQNMARWIETWPKVNHEQHRLAHSEIERGLDHDVSDLLSTCP